MEIFNTILLLLSLFMIVTESKMYLVKTKSRTTTTETINPTSSCTCGRAMAITKNKILSRIVGGIETKVRYTYHILPNMSYVMKTFLDVIASLVSSVRSVHNHFSNN